MELFKGIGLLALAFITIVLFSIVWEYLVDKLLDLIGSLYE